MAARARWLTALALGVAMVAGACGVGDTEVGSPGDASGHAATIEVEQIASTPKERVASALEQPLPDGLPQPLVDMQRVVSGGPPPDGIPPIDRPRFHRAGDVDFLKDREPVIAVEIRGEARAYPVQILTWHEIVNDTIGGEPVTVSYCPLCNTAIVYDRRLGERILDFGTSGRLYNSALVMYDRQTESLWSHFNAQAIAGVLTGEELDRHPAAMVGWGEWREANPTGLVLSRETGHDRNYGRNPYTGYDDIDQSPFLFDGDADGRLRPMTRVVGLGDADDAVAVQLEPLLQTGVMEVELGGEPVVVWAKRGTSSALDSSAIAEGRDVGTTGAFVPQVAGERLRFERDGDLFRDEQTGSIWNVLGEAIDGPHKGQQLQRVRHVDTFWFAWAAFLPDTQVVPPASSSTRRSLPSDATPPRAVDVVVSSVRAL